MTISIYCGALGNSDTVKDAVSPKSEGHIPYKHRNKNKYYYLTVKSPKQNIFFKFPNDHFLYFRNIKN